MFYNELYDQWTISNEEIRLAQFKWVNSLVSDGINYINSGQILTYTRGSDTLAFQTLERIDLRKVKGSDLVGYEPGSVISMRYEKAPKIVPTLLFRECRFPTSYEFSRYDRNNNL